MTFHTIYHANRPVAVQCLLYHSANALRFSHHITFLRYINDVHMDEFYNHSLSASKFSPEEAAKARVDS